MTSSPRAPELRDGPIARRFWAKVEKTDGCWLWRAATGANGRYGRFGIGSKVLLAHRVAWTLAHGELPDAARVLHRCDNPLCVNPAHLFLGTQGDNLRDMTSKGRHGLQSHPEKAARGLHNGAHTHPERRPRGDRHGSRTEPSSWARGEQNGAARLTTAKVQSIRQQYATGKVTQRQLAHLYGVSQGTIGFVLRGETWTTA